MENTVWKLIEDLRPKKGVTELIINGPESVYIEKEGDLIRLNVDIDPKHLIPFCKDVAASNKVLFGPENPIIDGNLDDGSRINIISSTYTEGSPAITIRKYLKTIRSFDQLDGKFMITDKWIQFFKALVASQQNVIISGGTGVGKTTFLNLMLNEVSPLERIITLEDTKELDFNSHNSVRLYTANFNSGLKDPLQMRDLVKNTLRMRPDRIILGEVRGAEAFDLLQSMNTGHEGSMCTVHANSPAEALGRLENLFLFAGFNVPLKAVRAQIANAVDFVIQLDRNRDGDRIVSSVTEVSNMESDHILTQEIGRLGDVALEFTGLVPKRIQQLMDEGLDTDFFIDL